MKSTKLLFIALTISFLITSCDQQKSQLFESSSKDGNLVLSVWGERGGTLDPWKVYVVADYKSQKDTVFTELHADELTTKNVQFNWNSNTNCTVKLIHRDGIINFVPISFNIGR